MRRVALVPLAAVLLVAAADGQDVEQREPGPRPPARIVASFDGLGAGFEGPDGGVCEERTNGDVVARDDQLADRWLVVMPIFSRRPDPFRSAGGAADTFAGQRFAARLDGDPLGQLTLREAALVDGRGAQNAIRWEDCTQTAIDPTDDCTIWYVGDCLKQGAATYSSRIGAFRLPGCS